MAGDAGTAQGQAQAGDGQGQAAEAQGAPDIGTLAASIADLNGGMEDMRSFLQTQPWQQQADDGQQQQEQEADQFDLSFLDPEAPGFDPEQMASTLQDLVDRAVEQRVSSAVQQHVQPVADRTAELQREREAEQLVQEFPALGDSETAQQLVQVSRQVAEAYGNPELGDQPWFWRLTYMAGQAADLANSEGDVPAPAVLEGGGGAMPGSFDGDLGDAIVNGSGGRNVLPFS
jgi:hypothetical protein